MKQDNWNQYEKLVMNKLSELTIKQEKMAEEVHLIRQDIIRLQVRAGMMGALAGVLPGAITALLMWLN